MSLDECKYNNEVADTLTILFQKVRKLNSNNKSENIRNERQECNNTSSNNNNTNNSWQSHSNQHCLACQQLLFICSCSHNQQKQLRQRIADLTDEEARNRHNIERAFNNSRSQYTASLEFTIDLCDIEDSETRYRFNLIRSVNKSFDALYHKFFFGFHFCNLETQERRLRSVIARNELDEHFANVRDFDANFNIARLLNSEQLARQSIEKAECETSYQLYTINTRLHHLAIAFVQSCEELERQYFAVSDEIEEDRSTSYRVLDQALTRNHQLVIVHHKERVALMEQAFAGRCRFEPLEEIRRSEIRRDFTEELFEVEQLVHMQAEERKQFMVLESRARDNNRAVGNSRFHSLLDRCEEEREGIKIEAERRVEDQLAVIRDALFELHQITNEEEESRKEILENQDTEKDATRQWILEKQIARNRFFQELRRARSAIWNEYQTDFDFIRQQRDDRETSIQLNAEILENEIDDFVSREAEYRSQIEDGRNADIRHLSLMIEGQLINIRRTIESRRSRISDLFHFEESSRQEILSVEGNAREFIESTCECVGKKILDREFLYSAYFQELIYHETAMRSRIGVEFRDGFRSFASMMENRRDTHRRLRTDILNESQIFENHDFHAEETRNRHSIELDFNQSRSQLAAALKFTIDRTNIEDSETRHRSELIRSFNVLIHKFFLEFEERRHRSFIKAREHICIEILTRCRRDRGRKKKEECTT